MVSGRARYRRFGPVRRSVTRPASFRTRRCCEIAGRVTSKRRAISPTESSAADTSRRISRRRGSPSAAKASTPESVSTDLRKCQVTVGRGPVRLPLLNHDPITTEQAVHLAHRWLEAYLEHNPWGVADDPDHGAARDGGTRATKDLAQRHPQAREGSAGQDRRPALRRPAGYTAALLDPSRRALGGPLRRRHRVRRIVHPRLPTHPRERHAPHARPEPRIHRSDPRDQDPEHHL